MKLQAAPVSAVASLVLIAASLVLFIAFKQAYQLRHFVGGDGATLLESLLRFLAAELVFGVAALLAAVGGLIRREGLVALIAAVLAAVNLILRGILM